MRGRRGSVDLKSQIVNTEVCTASPGSWRSPAGSWVWCAAVRGAALCGRWWPRGGSGNLPWKWYVKRAHRNVCKNTWREQDSLHGFFWRKFLLLPLPPSLAKVRVGNGSNGKWQLPTVQTEGENHISSSLQHQTTVVPPHCCQGGFPSLFRKLPTLRHHYCTERQTHSFYVLFRLVITKTWLW